MKNEITTPEALREYLATHDPKKAWNAPEIRANGYALRVYSSRDYAISKDGVTIAVDYYAEYITDGIKRDGITEIIARVFPESTAPKMATFEAVCAEIKAERNRAKKCEASTAYDLARDEFLAVYHSDEATEAEKATAKAKKEKAREAYNREQDLNVAHQLRAEILTDNAKQAFFAQYIGDICAIWNKYEGKPHGEKTADKIRAELKALTGQNIYIGNKYSDSVSISIYTARGVGIDNFEIGTASGCTARATDENNKILKIDPDAFRVWYCSEYVYNIGAHIKALKKARDEAQKAIEKAREAFGRYNDLTRGKIQRADIYRGSVPHYFI